MRTTHGISTPFILTALSASLCSCESRGQPELAGSARLSAAPVERRVTRVEYQYEGVLGVVGVPSKATAYAEEAMVAEARVIFDGELAPGSLESLEVEEKHYDAAGNQIYLGKIRFRIQFTGYVVQAEAPIAGRRLLRAFGDWPARH